MVKLTSLNCDMINFWEKEILKQQQRLLLRNALKKQEKELKQRAEK